MSDDLATIRALIEAQSARSEERHREVLRLMDHLEVRVAHLEQQVARLLSHRVTDQKSIEVLGNSVAKHLREHHGDEESGKPPLARTASAWTIANTYPGRVLAAGVGLLALVVQDVRLWVVDHAKDLLGVWWKIR